MQGLLKIKRSFVKQRTDPSQLLMMMMEHQTVMQKLAHNFNCSSKLNSYKLQWTEFKRKIPESFFCCCLVAVDIIKGRKGILRCSPNVEPSPLLWKEFSRQAVREMKNGAILYKSLKVFVIILRRGFNMLQLILSLFQNTVTLLTWNKWNNYHTGDEICHLSVLFCSSQNTANGYTEVV